MSVQTVVELGLARTAVPCSLNAQGARPGFQERFDPVPVLVRASDERPERRNARANPPVFWPLSLTATRAEPMNWKAPVAILTHSTLPPPPPCCQIRRI